ncbi:lipoyl domain-containing protein [Maribellus comscasis]|uniref:lipoyl domain-containing protein n=1 Tax=Maribellus comscasis TaxID=2681766 RepID=UPI00131C02C4|nr:biotin/lipoyl-containing protein [Maribellus comscasis]
MGDELWIRVFPDAVFLQSHNPNLSKEEKKDAEAFKKLTIKEQKKQAWEELVSKYGVYRSSWIVQISDKELQQQENNNDFTDHEPSFYFKWLPDRLVFYVYKEGEQKPTYKEDGSVIDRNGLSVLGEGDEWLQDFDKAIQAGMGIKIKIDPADTKFEKVIVSGFRYDENPMTPAKGLADLLKNHQYTEGFSFLNYGTPTNNTENVKSGHSARNEFEVADSYKYTVEGLNLEREDETATVPNIHAVTYGKYLGKGLGFEGDLLKHVQHADEIPPLLNELVQKASWFALGAQPLFMLLGNQLSNKTHEKIWQHYSKYVKTRGLYSALKIGNQPYGVLPVMNISNVFLPENRDIRESDKLFDKMLVLFAQLMKRWLLMAKNHKQVPRLLGGDTPEEILKILSMQESSGSWHIRALEYKAFKNKLYGFLQNHPSPTSINSLKGMGGDFENVQENVTSLAGLFNLDEKEFSAQIDQFLRAPILSFADGNTNLVGFEDGKAILTDQEGKKLTTGSTDSFSFAEEDPGKFQDFINSIKNQKGNELVQYKGDLSLFTDLFVRSYINACQLYFREIIFEPELANELLASQRFKISSIEKPEGSGIAKGDAVVTIEGANSKGVTISAPFDGTITKILVQAGENISPGTPLFTLKDEIKFDKMKASFINMGQEIINSIQAIPEGKEQKEAQKIAIGEAVDLNSYRLDAWISSLAARKIEELRSNPNHEKGIYFGTYGWIEDLEKDATPVNPESLTDIYREAGGIIHTPGVAQTIASSVFKNSFLSHKDEEQSNPFAVNLTSDRLQKGEFLLEGIRQGQQLEALLGYQLERHLHENNLHREIYTLREKFPLYENATGESTGFVNLSVIDGLKAIKNKESLPAEINAQVKEQVKKQIEKLEDSMDASLDTLFYEAGYQVTQGNLTRAAAAIDATKGEIEPPQIESLKTKIPGTGIKHKLVMIFQPGTEQFTIENTRAFAEPNLEKWLKENIGSMEQVACLVELRNIQNDSLEDTVEVTLKNLNISYLDFFYLSEDPVSDGAGELELRIRNAVVQQKGNLSEKTKYVITDTRPENSHSLAQALEVVRTAKVLLNKCRYLKSDDLTMESETTRYNRKALDEIKDKRLIPVIDHLKAIAASDLTQKRVLQFLSNLDFEPAKTAYLENTSVDTGKLKNAIETKITSAEILLSKYDSQSVFNNAFGLLQQVAGILFGETFILLPPAVGSANFNEVVNSKKQQLLVGNSADNDAEHVWGQERIKNWIQGIAQIHENSELFEDWLLVKSVWNHTMGLVTESHYTVVQGPTLLQYPWIALSKQEIDLLAEKQFDSQSIYKDSITGETYPLSDDTYYPEGSESTVLYAHKDLMLENPVFGLVIEEFSEYIPNAKMNTGLSFNYNIPNNEPPQALLLAVHPKAGQESDFFWAEDDLRDIIYDTMDLYKIRMVDLDAIQEYGYVLPMTYWFNIPGNK